MISEKLEQALNKQLNMELYSAYAYAAMASYFEHNNLAGFATWMRAQTQEEMQHAVKFYTYINDVGGRVVLDAIGKPKGEFDSALAVFEEALQHERAVTKSIYGLMDLALKESHHATSTFLQWFVTEQVEEEKVAGEIITRLKLVSNSNEGIFLMDNELGQRSSAGAKGETA